MSSKSSSASSPAKKGSSNIWPWIIRLIIFIVVVIIGIYLWNVIGSALTQAFKSILGMVGALANTVTQQLDKCGFTSQKQISCNSDKACTDAGMKDGTCPSGVCTDCGPDQKCSKGSCSALDANKRGTCSSAGLFASGCYMGWGFLGYGLLQLGLMIAGIFGAKRAGRSKMAEVSEGETGSENANLDSVDQTQLEEGAEEGAKKAVEDGTIKESAEASVKESAMGHAATNNTSNKVQEAVDDNQTYSAAERTAKMKEFAEYHAEWKAEQKAEAEKQAKNEEEGETDNETSDKIGEGEIPLDPVMMVKTAQAHMTFAQTHPDPEFRRIHATLGARTLKRLQQRKRKEKKKEKAVPFQTSAMLPQGNPIMPTTTTCGGIDYARLCEPPVVEVECAPDCFDPGFGCCDREAIYDCNWRSPNFGGLTACK